MPDHLTPFETAHRRLKLLGVAIERLPGEYRVRPSGGKESEWEGFESLPEAQARGDEFAAQRPLPQPTGGRRRRRRKPVYRTARAWMKAQRKAHNRKLWAVIGKIIER